MENNNNDIEKYEIFLYDLETSGLERDCQILTIALSHIVRCIKTNTFKERNKELFYVQPDIPFENINKKALEINGLKKEYFEYEKSKTWKEISLYVLNWILFHTREGRNPLLIGWNNHKFDDIRIQVQNKKYDITWTFSEHLNTIYTGDLITLFRKRNWKGNDGTFKLESVAKTYLKQNHIDEINFHEADGDVKAMVQLLINNNNMIHMNTDKNFLNDIHIRFLDGNQYNNNNLKKEWNNENNITDGNELIKKINNLNLNENKEKITNCNDNENNNKQEQNNNNIFWMIKGRNRFHIATCGYFAKSTKSKMKINLQDIIENRSIIKPCSCSLNIYNKFTK